MRYSRESYHSIGSPSAGLDTPDNFVQLSRQYFVAHRLKHCDGQKGRASKASGSNTVRTMLKERMCA